MVEGVKPIVVGLCHNSSLRSIESDGYNADIVKSDFGVKCLSRSPDVIHVSERGPGNPGNATVLVALDLSAAFDTIDHSVLINRLEYTLGLGVLPFNESSLISAVELALLKSMKRGLRQQAL